MAYTQRHIVSIKGASAIDCSESYEKVVVVEKGQTVQVSVQFCYSMCVADTEWNVLV